MKLVIHYHVCKGEGGSFFVAIVSGTG